MNTYKRYKSRILFILTLFMCMASVKAYGDSSFYFDNYNVEMTVHENGSYDVKESINAIFTSESRGILRDIPLWVWVKRDVSENQDGSQTKMFQYKVDVDNVTVSEQHECFDDEELYTIQIGSADKTINGPHSYSISYTLTPYGDRVEQSDLFFYSLLGTGWECDIKHFTFSIHFDKPLKDDELKKLEVFAGSLGSNSNVASSVVTKATATDIEGVRKNNKPQEAVTVRIPLREGYFAEGTHPKQDIQLAWLFTGISALLIIIMLCVEFWPKPTPTKIISFRPPKGMTSAEVGTIAKGYVNNNAILSLIPWLAEKGYISIDNTGEHPILKYEKDVPEDAPNHVLRLFNYMLDKKHKLLYTDQPAPAFGAGWEECRRLLSYQFHKKLNIGNLKPLWIYNTALVTVACANFFATIKEGVLAAIISAIMLGLLEIIPTVVLNECKQKPAPIAHIVGWSIFAMIYILSFCIGCFGGEDSTYIPLACVYGINIGMLTACFFILRLDKPTKERMEHLGEILGLKEFIETAEKQQLEKLQAEDEKYYYSILPYAVALGLADKWAERFKGIAVKTPEWYQGHKGEIATAAIATTITKTLMQSKAAESIAQKKKAYASSGSSYSSSSKYSSGGGGYAGGGFGGGGGRRW